MKLLLALLAAAVPASAQVPIVKLVPFHLDAGKCFTRPADYPDHDRVEPHLPTKVCLKEINGVLPFAADGSLVVDGTGPSGRATASGTIRYGTDGSLDRPMSQIHFVSGRHDWRAWFVADETPEDPAGDTGRTLVWFRLDRSGAVIPESVYVSGAVVCTFAASCTDGDLDIPYDDAK